MAHFQRELSDAAWRLGLTSGLATVLRNIDEKTRKAINGKGGAWNPSAPIVIGGAGVELLGSMTLSGGGHAQPDAGKNYTFGGDHTFLLSSRTHTIVTSLAESSRGIPLRDFRIDSSTFGLAGQRPGAVAMLPLRVHDGATIQSPVTVNADLPNTYTLSSGGQAGGARIVKIGRDGSRTVLRSSAGSDAFATTALAAGLSAISISIVPEVIDVSQFAYFVEIREAIGGSGSASWTHFMSAVASFTVTDLRPQ